MRWLAQPIGTFLRRVIREEVAGLLEFSVARYERLANERTRKQWALQGQRLSFGAADVIPASFPLGERWFAIYTDASAEFVVKEDLESQGFRIFLPCLTKRDLHQSNRRSRAFFTCDRPLFPRYMFVNIDLGRRPGCLREVRDTRGQADRNVVRRRILSMEPDMKIHELLAARGTAYDALVAVGTKKDFGTADQPEYDRLKAEVTRLDAEIARAKDLQGLAAASAQPVPGQETRTVPAAAETDRYVKEKSLIVGGVAKMIGVGGGTLYGARQAAVDLYGEAHPVTKALVTSSGSAGGFIVPPDVMNEVIPLLRAQAVVLSAGPRVLPMPRGTMTLPGQASAATAGYGNETKPIGQSQPSLNQIVATFKKLAGFVPVSNDMMRYADPAVDAFVRDDLVRVMALRQDLAFIMSDGTLDTPRGFLYFANGWVAAKGGTIGVWSQSAASVFAINAADPSNSTGGNFITSNGIYTLVTVAQELGGAVNRLDTANVPDNKRVWFMHPRSYNYLFNVQNSLGVYVYRDELVKGTLLGYPFKKTTQIPNNFWDATGTNKDLSFVFLVEMTEDMVFDSMQLELAVSREGTYVDTNGVTVSAFQSDQTIIRAIAEHDHQMRHDAAVAVIQGTRWAPAIQ